MKSVIQLKEKIFLIGSLLACTYFASDLKQTTLSFNYYYPHGLQELPPSA